MLDISQDFQIPDQKTWVELAKASLKNEKDLIYETVEGLSLGLDYSEQAPLVLRTFQTNPQLLTEQDFQKTGYTDIFLNFENSKQSWKEFSHDFQGDNLLINIARVHNAGASIVQELEFALSVLEQVADKTQSVTFLVALDSLYFCNLAKLRALRFLLESLQEKMQIPEFKIITEPSLREQTQFGIYNNMLRATLAVTAAINGGSDLIKVRSFDDLKGTVSKTGVRQAENCYHVLTEESFLGKIQDPAAGSYAIESLTRDLIHLSFENFKKTLKSEGLFNNIKKWSLEVEITAKKREVQVLEQQSLISGVNSYANLEDEVFNPIINEKSEYFPLRRSSEKLENMRKQLSEMKVNISLVKFGPDKMSAARIGFAKNILEVSGLKVNIFTQEEFMAQSKKTDVLVLCAADDDYPETYDIDAKIKLITTKAKEIRGYEKLFMGKNIYDVFSPLLREVKA